MWTQNFREEIMNTGHQDRNKIFDIQQNPF